MSDVPDHRDDPPEGPDRADDARQLATLRAVLDQAPAAFALIRGDDDPVYVFSNAENDRLAGRSIPDGARVLDVLPEVVSNGLLGVLRHVMRTGEPWRAEELPVHLDPPDGPPRTLYLSGMYQPVLAADGTIDGVLAFAYEVTDLVRARERAESLARALEESQQHLRGVTDNASAALFLMDGANRCTFLNPAAVAMTGYTLAELQERPLHDYVHHRRPDGRPFPMEECPIGRALGEQRDARGEEVFVRKDGSFVPVAYAASPIVRDGVAVGTVLEVRDISDERRRREDADLLADVSAALAASIDLASLLREVTRVVTMRWADGCTVHVAGEREGDRLTVEGHCLAAADDPPGAPAVRGGSPGEEGPSHLAVDLRLHGRVLGELRLERRGSRRFDAAHEQTAIELARRLAVAVDNAQLFELNQRERRRAEDASRAKDELLSITSHELRTPLSAILGWARLLKGGLLDEAKRARAIDTIERNARAQAQLVDDLLDVSRVMTGKLKLEVERVDVAAVVEAAVDVVRPAADAKNIRVDVVRDVDDAGAIVHGDASRLQQVCWNLLSNAVKFTPRGGAVEVRLVKSDGRVEIGVTDTGVGIEPAFLPHVFQPFRQQDASITRSHGGLGLGLAIVKHLVELHGGAVEARSVGTGRGATFVIDLPVGSTSNPPPAPAPAAAPSSPVGLPGSAPSLRDLDVLIVDDDADTRDLVGSIVEAAGGTPRTAASVTEALARLREAVPDVLVSDVGMPDASGYDLIRRVRALPRGAGGQVPALALTAHTSAADRTRALREGFTAHASKPADPAELTTLLASLARATGDR